MFDRYDIHSTEDLRRGVARRFDDSTDNGKGTANKTAEPVGVE